MDRRGEQLIESLHRDMLEMVLAATVFLHIAINGPYMLRQTFSKLCNRE
jgi:hypothetical protein